MFLGGKMDTGGNPNISHRFRPHPMGAPRSGWPMDYSYLGLGREDLLVSVGGRSKRGTVLPARIDLLLG